MKKCIVFCIAALFFVLTIGMFATASATTATGPTYDVAQVVQTSATVPATVVTGGISYVTASGATARTAPIVAVGDDEGISTRHMATAQKVVKAGQITHTAAIIMKAESK
jgi:hypothetical protein